MGLILNFYSNHLFIKKSHQILLTILIFFGQVIKTLIINILPKTAIGLFGKLDNNTAKKLKWLYKTID